MMLMIQLHFDGHLATITSYEENQFLNDALTSNNNFSGGSFWIGGFEDYYDPESGDRSFSWVTGEDWLYEN